MIIIERDKVDTSGAFTADLMHIDIELQSSTVILMPVGPPGAVVQGVVKDEGAVIQSHLNCGIGGLEVFSVESLQEEFPNANLAAISDE